MSRNTPLTAKKTYAALYNDCDKAYTELSAALKECRRNESDRNAEYQDWMSKADSYLFELNKIISGIRTAHDHKKVPVWEIGENAKKAWSNAGHAQHFICSIIKDSKFAYGSNRGKKLEGLVAALERHVPETKHNVTRIRPARMNEAAEAGAVPYKGRKVVAFNTGKLRISGRAKDDSDLPER